MGYHFCCCLDKSSSVAGDSAYRLQNDSVWNYPLKIDGKLQTEKPKSSSHDDSVAATEVKTMIAMEETPVLASYPRENELSDTIVCSSTTVEETSTRQLMFHQRMETTASTTWPDVSMPTTSLRYDHMRTHSGNDSEDDFSAAEQTPSVVRERRTLYVASERERAALRDIVSTEKERRHGIVQFFNNARRIIAIRYYKGILNMERREMLVEHFDERYALLLRVAEAQESMARLLIELEGQAELLGRMQQHRLERRRNFSVNYLTAPLDGSSDIVLPAGKIPARGRSISEYGLLRWQSQQYYWDPLQKWLLPQGGNKSVRGFKMSMYEPPRNESVIQLQPQAEEREEEILVHHSKAGN